MEVDQKLGATPEVWQIEARNVAFLLWFIFLCRFFVCIVLQLVHVFLVAVGNFTLLLALTFVAILVLFRLITYAFQRELFFCECIVPKVRLSEPSCFLRSLRFLLGVHHGGRSLSVSIGACLRFRVLKLDYLSSCFVSGVLWHVDNLTNETCRAVAWRGRWEQKLVQLHSLII